MYQVHQLFRNDQHCLKIVVDSENESDLMVQFRHIRDVILLLLDLLYFPQFPSQDRDIIFLTGTLYSLI